VVCFTGKPRQSAINNWAVFKAHIDNKGGVQNNLERISQIAQQMRTALEVGDFKETGRLMNVEWQFRKKSLPTISTKTIDRIIENSRRKGALAGKVCGAGGGGCLVLLIEPEARERVEKVVVESGGELLPMQIDRQGVTVVSQ
jgi:D-glycero-alpha-D-manno-heptose-7-phosphate kinase